jgi:hypothetical protein
MMKNKDNIKIKSQNKVPDYVNTFISTHNLVQKNKRKKQPLLTALQTELLYLYPQALTPKQRKQLHIFLFYLLNDDCHSSKSKQAVEQYDLQPKKKLAVQRDKLTSFQNELLNVYDHEPNDAQMQQLKDFLAQLFPEKLAPSKEIVA